MAQSAHESPFINAQSVHESPFTIAQYVHESPFIIALSVHASYTSWLVKDYGTPCITRAPLNRIAPIHVQTTPHASSSVEPGLLHGNLPFARQLCFLRGNFAVLLGNFKFRAKLPSKMQIVVQKSWSNCLFHSIPFYLAQSFLPRRNAFIWLKTFGTDKRLWPSQIPEEREYDYARFV